MQKSSSDVRDFRHGGGAKAKMYHCINSMHNALHPRERSSAHEPVFQNPANVAALDELSEGLSEFLESGIPDFEPNRSSSQTQEIQKKAEKCAAMLSIATDTAMDTHAICMEISSWHGKDD